MKQLDHYINGLACEGRSGRYAEGFDPALGTVTHSVPLASPAEVDAAVAAARMAFPAWAGTPAQARARVLDEFRALLRRHQDELAETIVREQGKAHAEALDEVARGIEAVEHACGTALRLDGGRIARGDDGVESWRARSPLGVVLGITPSSLPLLAPCAMFALALACGNTVVLKPSQRTPSAPLRLARLLRQAGLPDGAFNVLYGDKQAADALIAHRGIAAVAFRGTAPAAQDVLAEGTRHGKRVQALGSAKHHLVVLPDADLDLAADALMDAAFGAASLRGLATAAAVAVGDAGDALAQRLAPRVRALAAAPAADLPANDGARLGPLATAQHRLKVVRYIEDGEASGATLLVDGRGLSVPGRERGFFLGGTLFDHVTPRMNIYREEIYGPVLSILRVPDLAAAIALVNGHASAGAASCFTADAQAAHVFGQAVRAGTVGINLAVPAAQTWQAFGGWRGATLGGARSHGDDGMRFLTQDKNIMQRWPGDAAPDNESRGDASPHGASAAHDTGNAPC
ncbi:CoA-acylating methylmalonate-semialdehyde dehydrogenase [Bordetella genomosp. 13]|uniref:CoA-acylating methylmalonate-semialdehyde dehydrogenase n=1 Tax=Bordetella genomosp. 13 TaxID=463040 RepID=UPI0011AA4CA4|nr:CoA-acylating methylmalonate-semialdehyde dehydrogenase [Bordetella genomosp. 13]